MKSHDEVKQWYLDAVNQSQDSRAAAERDLDYYHNKQWTASEEAELKKRKQPVVTINRIKPKVDALIGMEIQSRVDIKAFPRNPNDEQSSEAVTDSLRYIADNSDFDQVKSDSAFDLFVPGTMLGIVEVEKTARGFDVMPRQIPWDRGFIDPHSCRKDGKDAKYMGQAIWMDAEDAKELFPDADLSMFGNFGNEGGDTYDDKPKNMFFDSKRDRVKVIEIYYHHKGWKHRIFTGFGDLVEERDSPYVDEDSAPVNPIEVQSAFIDRDNNRYGFVRQLISPQDEINKRRSKSLHLLSVRQVIAEEGAVENVTTARKELNKPDGWIVKRPGMDLQIANTSDMAVGQVNLLQEAKNEIDSIGANAATMGKDDRAQSGRAMQVRAQAGVVELTPVLDGLRSWEKRMYRQMWLRVRQFWTEEKWIRVTDDERNMRFVGLNRPITMREVFEQRGTPYDVNDPRINEVVGTDMPVADLDVDIVLEAVPDMVNLQAEQFELLAGMFQANPNAIPFDMVIEASSIRNKERILERINGGGEDPEAQAAKQQAAQEAYQLEKADKVADIKGKESKASKDAAMAQKYQVDAMRGMHSQL